jgi:hypothetical protein
MGSESMPLLRVELLPLLTAELAALPPLEH